MISTVNNIDLKDILDRSIAIFNKSYQFYTISNKKNIGRRSKLRTLHLLQLFPNIQQTLKGYNTIKNTNYNDFITRIINNDSKESHEKDTENLQKLLNDINIVYNEYFNKKKEQKGGGNVADVADTEDTSNTSANEVAYIPQLDDVAKNELKKRIQDICDSSTIDINSIMSLIAGDIDDDIYTLLTKDHKDIFNTYNMTEELSEHLKKIFPPDDDIIDYLTPSKSVTRIANLLKLFVKYEDIIISIVNNIIRLRDQGIRNPFLMIIESVQSAIVAIIHLKDSISDIVDAVRFIANTIALIGLSAGATGDAGVTTGTGIGATGTHEVLGAAGIVRILIDFFTPYVIFFSLIMLKQDEKAADILISYHPLFLDFPINTLYSISSIISNIVNMKNIYMILATISRKEASAINNQSGTDIIQTIYKELKTSNTLKLDSYSLDTLTFVKGIHIKISNIILSQLIDLLSFEGACIVLNLNFKKNIMPIFQTLQNMSITASKQFEMGQDIITSSTPINIFRLLFGMQYTQSFRDLIADPTSVPKMANAIRLFIAPSSSPEVKSAIEVLITSLISQDPNAQPSPEMQKNIDILEHVKTKYTDVEIGGLMGILRRFMFGKSKKSKTETKQSVPDHGTVPTTVSTHVPADVPADDAVDAPADVPALTISDDTPTPAISDPAIPVPADASAVPAPPVPALKSNISTKSLSSHKVVGAASVTAAATAAADVPADAPADDPADDAVDAITDAPADVPALTSSDDTPTPTISAPAVPVPTDAPAVPAPPVPALKSNIPTKPLSSHEVVGAASVPTAASAAAAAGG